jgi:hypothetical protein
VATKTAAILVVLCAALPARAQIDLSLGGYIYDDVRFVIDQKNFDQSSQVAVDRGFDRNETRLRLTGTARAGENVKALGDFEFVWTGFSRAPYAGGDKGYGAPATLADLSTLTTVDPFYLIAYAAYVDLYHVLPGLDLRLGRQIVTWGVADKFSPTNNLNSLDLEDPLRFGQGIANDMVRADWNRGDFIVTAVWVPIFRPARLPRTAPLGLHSLARIPYQDDDLRHNVASLLPTPAVTVQAYPLLPEADLSNSQGGVRISGRVGGVDLAASYYNGRHDLPVPVHTRVYVSGSQLAADTTVGFPRMQVAGLDVAGQIAALADMGFWVETAVVFPQEMRMGLVNASGLGPPQFLDANERDGIVIPDTPYLKATVGVDHTLAHHLYLNVQYVHGFIDEFGSGRNIWRASDSPRREVTSPREGNYVVAGADYKFRDDRILIRLFGVYDFDDSSAVVFPQIVATTWAATELSLGAFVYVGSPTTKFGDPAAGASQAFARAKFSW